MTSTAAFEPKRHRSRDPLLTLAILMCVAPLPSVARAEPPRYDRVVVFGDSISDGGSYADRAPPGAGRFTTNPDHVWVEVVAQEQGLGVKPHLTEDGSNYAEGGARVAVPRPNALGNLSRRPITAQVDDFLANDGKLGRDSLVIISGGGNDVFATQANGLAFTPEDLAVLDTAALDLTNQIVRLGQAGAGTLVTTSVPKFEVFNERFRRSLAASGANVLYFDAARLIGEIEQNPAAYGIVNIKDRACRGLALESFTCLPADYVTPDANRTYLFADAVHFTGVVHEMLGRAVSATLAAPSQVSQLLYLPQAGLQANGRWLSEQLSNLDRSERGWGMLGSLGYDSAELSPTRLGSGLSSHGVSGSLGGWSALGPETILGAVASWSEHEGDFAGDGGAFDGRTLSATVFGQTELGGWRLAVSGTYGSLRFGSIARRVDLSTAVRIEEGRAEGSALTFDATVGRNVRMGAINVSPSAQLRYERLTMDPYAEAGQSSTRISYSGQRVETLFISPGLEMKGTVGGLRPHVAVRYHHDLLDRRRSISITPEGAPVSLTTDAYVADGSFLTLKGGVTADLSEASYASLGADLTAGRGDFDAVALRATVGLRF
jgi:outer membrane lipase/esterase